MGNPVGLIHSSILLALGSSQSGKTVFMCRLARFANQVYNYDFKHIIWCYEGPESTIPREQLKNVKNITFRKGVPDSFTELPHHSLIFVDDCSKETINSKSLLEAATFGVHHNDQSIVIALHNIFTGGKNFKTICNNSHYYVLFRTLRDRQQVDFFFRQIDPKNWRDLRTIFENEVVARPYSYLVIDCHPASHIDAAFRIKGRMFPDDEAATFFATEKSVNSLNDEAK